MGVYVTPVSAGMLPTSILVFSPITGVANSIETTILSYTCLGDETIGDIVLSGTDYARFNVYLNTSLSFVVRSGPSRQANLQLQRPWQLQTGDVIDIKVIHYNTAATADFEATLMGV
jgi:hypothetical protein